MNLRNTLNIQSLLWLALALALAGSLRHLAAVFASVDGNYPLGWLQAIAIDTGLFALSYSLRGRKEAKRGVKITWIGITVFTIISVYGNLAYGFFATSGQFPDWITVSKPYVLAASLPVLVLYLAELLADDRQHSVNEAAKEAKRLAKITGQDDVKSTFGPDNLAKANEAKQGKIDHRRDQVLTLRQQNLTHQAIAQQLGVSLSTVKTDLKAVNNGHLNGQDGGQ